MGYHLLRDSSNDTGIISKNIVSVHTNQVVKRDRNCSVSGKALDHWAIGAGPSSKLDTGNYDGTD